MKQSRKSQPFLRKHSLSLAALAVVIVLIVLYHLSNPSTHLGSFFGNAIADWTGVFVTIVMTKFLYEKGSAESKQRREYYRRRLSSSCASTRSPYSLSLSLRASAGS